MVLNQDGDSVYLRKSAAGKEVGDYVFYATLQFENPQLKTLKADKINPIYYLVYEGKKEEMSFFYGKVIGPDLEKGEKIAKKVPRIEKSIYSFQGKKATHYKIVPKNTTREKILEKEKQQLNIIRIYLKTLFFGGLVLSLPLFILALFFHQGPLALAIFLFFLVVRIQNKIPNQGEITMSCYDL